MATIFQSRLGSTRVELELARIQSEALKRDVPVERIGTLELPPRV